MKLEGNFDLAFLDLLSCALGATILLFLIFSTLEHFGESRTRTEMESAEIGTAATAQPAGSGPTVLPRLFGITLKPETGRDLPGHLEYLSSRTPEVRPVRSTNAPGSADDDGLHYLVLAPEFSQTGLDLTFERLPRGRYRAVFQGLAGVGPRWRETCLFEASGRPIFFGLESDEGMVATSEPNFECQPDEDGR